MKFSIRNPILMMMILAVSFLALQTKADDYDDFYSKANAYGGSKDPLPESSRLAGSNEFYNRFKEGSLILDTPAQAAAAARKTQSEVSGLDVQAAKAIGATRTSLLLRLMGVSGGFDTSISLTNNKNQKAKEVLMARQAILRDVVGAQALFARKDNQLLIYKYLQSRLTGEQGLPALDLATATADSIRLANDALLGRFEMKFSREVSIPLADYGKCEAEEGSGVVGTPDDGDQTGDVCSANPKGLIAAADWTLKTANTCVRNQGERGTSAAFALTAAVESQIVRDQRRFSNLSEQHLFNQMTSRWFRAYPDNQDNIAPLFSSGTNIAAGYRFHFEDVWDYNGSYDRAMKSGPFFTGFTNSCHWYDGPACSNTNHQSRMLCANVGEFRFCGYDAPMPIATPNKVGRLAVIYNINDPNPGLLDAKRWLHSGVPLILTFAVTSDFASSKTGYLGAPSNGDRILGGQNALVTGWVPNSSKPAGVPDAPGGGYFVVKNSWGRCVGDSGYYYLPADWVRAYAINLVALF